MRKINKITNTANSDDEFTDGVVAAGIQPTILPAGWFNVIQRELVAVVEGAGLSLDDNNDKQVSEIIGGISSVVNHYRNYGYPLWENTIPYETGTVVRHNDALYLSLTDNNRVVPGTTPSFWQPYIQREATKDEAILGAGSQEAITPRRLHDGASYLDEQLKIAMTPYLLPIGAIIMWPSETPPNGWLELNGQQFDMDENPKLAAMFPSGRVPDYRGRFVRAWANGSTIDTEPDREIGSMQNDAMQPIVGEWIIDDMTIGGGFPNGAVSYDRRSALGYDATSEARWAGFVARLDSSRVTRTADETRPRNVSAMYIIKTDRAESTPGAQTPTAIVLTPQSAIVNSGTTRQFSAAVLPAEFQNDYPVSWSVSDSALGSISSTGLYTAAAGQTGTQTIIASISTGLTQIVTLNQYVFLTTTSIAAIPNIEVEDTYNLAVTFTPTSYTEPVDYASSDAQIASVINGTVTGVGAGTATASVTGRYSGVTASRPVTITPKIVVEKYLQINERLSEIADAGTVAQATARNNLGLRALATRDSLTAADVSAVPQSTASLGTENLNTVISLGRKFQSLTSNATLARNYPVALAGMLDVIRTTDAGIRQTFYPDNTTDVYHRYCVDTAANPVVFSAWAKSGGDYLEKSQNLADVPNKPTARDNLGVGYTVSTSVAPTDATGYAAGHMWYREES
ncbi:phage tail protein [Pectobacterium polaris]|uniref:tail fiber protein n=1 Tax=Pectobacterium polaris TaxID=2042057 RepID=UPI000D620989|nr:tail fiber protein [Pectobacterium polaris]MCU1787770.1 phage tail protein [Pectobacterium polaris]PWD57169.1 phage tail protein [Pectobacterium polaris]